MAGHRSKETDKDVIFMKINGEEYKVEEEDVDERLVNFLHKKGLRGTHLTCYEGGCGACTVVVSVPNVGGCTDDRRMFAVNSCLVSLYGCDDWDIKTVEGLGNRFDGYHDIQNKLVQHNGTQCGYCSPGMVMAMYGLMGECGDESWDPEDVEKSLDGNLCRCTGYRPILDAFKAVRQCPSDIEDIGLNIKRCPKDAFSFFHKVKRERKNKEISVEGVKWFRPTSLKELNEVIGSFSDGVRYRLVCGNTGTALYDDEDYGAYVNTTMVPELYTKTTSSGSVNFGSNLSITEVIKEFRSLSKANPKFRHLHDLADHWEKVANKPVRNLGSVGGNLMLRSQHHEFPSDLFITLLAARAKAYIISDAGKRFCLLDLEEMARSDFTQTKSILLQIRIYSLSPQSVYRSFKVMPRTANSRAYVAAAFCMEVDRSNGYMVTDRPILAYTGIGSDFVRPLKTEFYLLGKSLKKVQVLQEALKILSQEIKVEELPEDPSPKYKISIAQNLLYKFILGIVEKEVSPIYQSGSLVLERPISCGKQTYEENKQTWPLGKPIPKLEAKIQCSGEAEFVKTMKPFEGELVGMFVQSTEANADIKRIETKSAYKIPGVIGFLSAEDIPGKNNIIVYADPNYTEELLASKKVSYYGQPIGIIIATSREAAYAGIHSIEVDYENRKPIILTIEDAITNNSTATHPGFNFERGDVGAGFKESDQIIQGSMSRDGQFHFHMEMQSCVAVPTEDGLDVYPSTQWIAETQASIAQVLGVSDNAINLNIKRCGGAFGAKIDRCNIIACGSALAAQIFRKPVKIDLDLDTNMTMMGWREPYLCQYKIGVSKEGLLKAVEVTLTCDAGYLPIDASSYVAVEALPSCYACKNWKIMPQVAITNTASNTWCRTPATVEGIMFMENIMEHVATRLNMDPLELRKKNLLSNGTNRQTSVINPQTRAALRSNAGPNNSRLLGRHSVNVKQNRLPDMIDQIIKTSSYEERRIEVEAFNTNNRWRKKGIAVMPMLWPYICPDVNGFSVIISIYAHDGSVAVAHGGIEMGQGINTKVAQTAAYILGCDLDKIKIKASNSLSGANSNITGGSIGSDANMYCIKEAAKRLRTRLERVWKSAWEETVKAAFEEGIDLTEHYWNGKSEVKSYPVFGVACSEVEVDVLTGNFLIRRVDILEDAGKSPNPFIDIGQVEGAFVMGQGLFTTEKPIYDKTTGRKISDTTWIYKPPTALDIPVDFRVTLLENAPNDIGVLSSKVTGEPPLCLSFSVVMALRQAISCARADAGQNGWFNMDCPMTVDKIQELCIVEPSMLTYGHSKYI